MTTRSHDAPASSVAFIGGGNMARSLIGGLVAAGTDPGTLRVADPNPAARDALATDFGKFAKKSPAVFKGKAGATTEWGKTRRLLVGPFKDRKTAQDWLVDYKKAGGDGFLFNSEAGQSVDPVK